VKGLTTFRPGLTGEPIDPKVVGMPTVLAGTMRMQASASSSRPPMTPNGPYRRTLILCALSDGFRTVPTRKATMAPRKNKMPRKSLKYGMCLLSLAELPAVEPLDDARGFISLSGRQHGERLVGLQHPGQEPDGLLEQHVVVLGVRLDVGVQHHAGAVEAAPGSPSISQGVQPGGDDADQHDDHQHPAHHTLVYTRAALMPTKPTRRVKRRRRLYLRVRMPSLGRSFSVHPPVAVL